MTPTQTRHVFNPNPKRSDGTPKHFTDEEFTGQSWRHFGRDYDFEVVEFLNGEKLYLTKAEFERLSAGSEGMEITEFKAMQAEAAENKKPGRKPSPDKMALVERAKELGINPTAKTAEQLQKLIAEKEAE